MTRDGPDLNYTSAAAAALRPTGNPVLLAVSCSPMAAFDHQVGTENPRPSDERRTKATSQTRRGVRQTSLDTGQKSKSP